MLIFSSSEYESRWKRADRALAAEGLEAAVVWGRTASTFDRAGDVIYLTNYFSSKVGQGFDAPPFAARAYCAVILRRGAEPVLIADDPDVHSDVVSVCDFRVAGDPIAKTVDTLREFGISGRIGFVGTDFFPVKYWDQLIALKPDVDWTPCDDLIRRIRMVKSTAEMDVIRVAGKTASKAMSCMMEALIEGATETAAAASAAECVVAGGGVIDKIQINHGKTIAYTCGDPLSGYRNVAPERGDLLRGFIIGPFYQGYYLDPGRTAVCGNVPNDVQAALIESCADIVEAIAAAINPGVRYSTAAAIGDRMTAAFAPDMDPAAEKFPFFGHPHGLYFEGPPYISTVLEHQNAVFEEGMLIGVEAFLARKGVGNAGFEQNYLVTATGLECVTTTPMLWHRRQTPQPETAPDRKTV
ncbi:M24 family metallopeptidase [Pelagibius sp. Alg239-R121]|uniref:M24 family metallopeptidase n=1 Tax=Pelagibius sp. Alg239-R121 TaxID=2993448 RepID=UPI0024A769C4|nr:M24 family metallopeptidase [Pelagibius sp. Alg239-R121]